MPRQHPGACQVVLVGVLLLTCTARQAVRAEIDASALFNAFIEVFPLKDGSQYLASYNTSVLEQQALLQLAYLGVPDNITLYCQLPEADIVRTLMLAALGNLLVNTTDSDGCGAPFVSDATSGHIERANSFAHNRVLIFEIIIFSLLIALARAWFVIQTYEMQEVRLDGPEGDAVATHGGGSSNKR